MIHEPRAILRCRWKVALPGSLAIVAAAIWSTTARPALAFDHFWFPLPCATESALWDDAPGAGANNEAGFFWLAGTAGVSTTCTVESDPPSLSTTQFSMVTVRAAVNDGAKLIIELREGSEPEDPCEGPLIQELFIADTSANSGFVTLEETLPAGFVIAAVCMSLNDVGAGNQRASALIDDIRIWAPGTCLPGRRGVVPDQPGLGVFDRGRCTGWRETFSRPN